jgi:hypothetical protein
MIYLLPDAYIFFCKRAKKHIIDEIIARIG